MEENRKNEQKWALWGFRSKNAGKFIIAILWYILCAAVLYFGITSPCPVEATGRDLALFRANSILIFFWMISPAIFLSDSPIRKHVWPFKKKEMWFSVLGMMIVNILFAYSFAQIENSHSTKFKDSFSRYIESSYQGFVDAGTKQ